MNGPRILVIPGCNRSGSVTVRLAGTVTYALAKKNALVTRISLSDYEMPFYDGPPEPGEALPKSVLKFANLCASHDGIVLVSPQYNGSIPPLLKNMLDWLSHSPDSGKLTSSTAFALVSGSHTELEGRGCLGHLQDILTAMGVQLVEPSLSVHDAASHMDENDELTGEEHQKQLQNLCDALIKQASIFARG